MCPDAMASRGFFSKLADFSAIILKPNVISVKSVRKLACNADHFASLIYVRRPFLSGLWRGRSKWPTTHKHEGDMPKGCVWVRQIRPALLWFRAFLQHRTGSRIWRQLTKMRANSSGLWEDAFVFGLGAYSPEDGAPISWYASDITPDDEPFLNKTPLSEPIIFLPSLSCFTSKARAQHKTESRENSRFASMTRHSCRMWLPRRRCVQKTRSHDSHAGYPRSGKALVETEATWSLDVGSLGWCPGCFTPVSAAVPVCCFTPVSVVVPLRFMKRVVARVRFWWCLPASRRVQN